MSKVKDSKFVDMFDGKIFTLWEDGEFIYFAMPWVTVNFPKEWWNEIKEELLKIGEL